MRKLVPSIILISGLVAIVALYEPTAPEKESYGDVAKRECAREADRSKQDQEDCYSKKLIAKALQMQTR